MTFIEQEELSEQERIQVVSAMIAICLAVQGSENYHEIVNKAELIDVPSLDTAKLTGIPLEIVNLALQNLQEDGIITIESIEDIE